MWFWECPHADCHFSVVSTDEQDAQDRAVAHVAATGHREGDE